MRPSGGQRLPADIANVGEIAHRQPVGERRGIADDRIEQIGQFGAIAALRTGFALTLFQAAQVERAQTSVAGTQGIIAGVARQVAGFRSSRPR